MILTTMRAKYGQQCLDWSQYFDQLILSWSRQTMTIQRIQEIRDWVYFCLQRNLRWQEAGQHILEAVLQSSLPEEKLHKAVAVLAKEPSTGGGQTLSSYRIPIAWEHLGIEMASALAQTRAEVSTSLATVTLNA